MRLLSKNLYTAKQLSETSWEVTLAEESHPVFKAHFEGNPLLPAFLQIDIFAEILGKKVKVIKKCKFKQPILPNDVVEYTIVKKNEESYKVNISKNTISTSELKITLI